MIKLNAKVPCKLQPIAENTTILGVDGTPLKVVGSGKFSLRLGCNEVCCQTIVANIKADGILGLHFLKTSGCLVGVSQTKISYRVENMSYNYGGILVAFT